jgi:hypothetical protein
MKKLLTLLLAIVYISLNTGATVSLHFCMDKLVNWSLGDNRSQKCKSCGMEKDENCCKDENRFVRVDSDQTLSGTIQFVAAPVINIFSLSIDMAWDRLRVKDQQTFSHSSAPGIGVNHLIRNCVFRI